MSLFWWKVLWVSSAVYRSGWAALGTHCLKTKTRKNISDITSFIHVHTSENAHITIRKDSEVYKVTLFAHIQPNAAKSAAWSCTMQMDNDPKHTVEAAWGIEIALFKCPSHPPDLNLTVASKSMKTGLCIQEAASFRVCLLVGECYVHLNQ